MKKGRIITAILSFTLMITCFMLSTINVKAVDNRVTLAEGYYGVTETLENIDLQYGLSSINYIHDQAYSCMTDSSWIVGTDCGGSTYSPTQFYANKEYTQSAHVLTISKDSNVKIIPWSIIKNGKWTLSTILQVASDYESKHPGWKVIAATNGDFFDINATSAYPYNVIGSMVTEGEVLRTNDDWPVVALKNDGSDTPIFKVDSPQFSETPYLSIYDSNDNIIETIQLDSVNGDIGVDETGVYFANYRLEGKAHLIDEFDIDNAYIVSGTDTVTSPYANYSFYGIGTISDIGSGKMSLNNFAIKTNNNDLKAKLAVGVKIRVQYEFTDELAGIENVCGCVATFLKDGEHCVRDHYDYMQYRYPRTLIGCNNNGDVVLAVTDGRQPDKGYYGLNGIESAAQMIYYGCTEAYSFDGGGSSTMAILKDGKLTCVNSPSDGDLRYDSNAILIVTKVPELDITYDLGQTSLSVCVDEVTEIEGYDNYYVKMNNEMVEVKDGKATFNNLTSNTEYTYQLYVKKGDAYNMMPYGGTITTSKDLYEIKNLTLKLVGDKYQVTFDLDDPQKSIVTCVLIVGGKRYDIKSGSALIDLSQGSPATCDSKLVVTYELNTVDGRKAYDEKTYDLVFSDTTTVLSSFLSEIDYRIKNILK